MVNRGPGIMRIWLVFVFSASVMTKRVHEFNSLENTDRRSANIHIENENTITVATGENVRKDSSKDSKRSTDRTSTGSDMACNKNNDDDLCDMHVSKRSVEYFRSRLQSNDPHFVHFNIQFMVNDEYRPAYNVTPDTFQADQWVWTYWSPSGLYPYLSWNIDYSVLSFGLLDTKTLNRVRSGDIFVLIKVPETCNITLGDIKTTKAIAKALCEMTSKIVKNETDGDPKYDESYYCYLAEAPGMRQTFAYQAAVYLLFPISYINYNCCVTSHNYTTGTFSVKCDDEQIQKWTQCILGPFILGIIIFLLYNPLMMFRIAEWISSDENVLPSDYEMIQLLNGEEPAVLISHEGVSQDDEWLYLNGKSPYKFSDLFSNVWCGMNKRWPTAISRTRRLFLLLLIPIGLYIKILVYKHTMYEKTRLLLKHKTPMGFLSLLAEHEDQKKAFVTYLGGPIVILLSYYTVGFLFLVLPRSVKQIMEDGMPRPYACFSTPVVLSVAEVKRLSMVNKPSEPGYRKGVTLFICGVYMIFSKTFWIWVFQTQISRIQCNDRKPTKKWFVLKIVLMPFYLVFCILEILISLLVHGVPFVMFCCIILRGVIKSLVSFRAYILQFCHNTIIRKLILKNPLVGILTFFGTAFMLTLFAYSVCLIFMDTFNFVSEVVVYCFVAVIVFPSVAFGYLFFFVVLLYYIVRLIKDFGDTYLDLLSETVEISRNLDGHPNYVTFFEEDMIISNVQVPVGIKRIRLNNTPIDVAQNVVQSVANERNLPKVKLVNNMYAIPRDLFDYLIKKHRPPHQKLMKIFLHIIFIVILIWLTISISDKYVSGPSSEISEVMHVIFLMAVGALPRILEVAMMTGRANIIKEIELRSLEESIVNYWRNQG